MTVLLKKREREREREREEEEEERHDMNVDGHDTPLIPIYISLTECIRSWYNKYGEVTKNITDLLIHNVRKGDFCSLLCMLQQWPRPRPMACY
jgi:hypothetical protein